jgi:hypothetical protein
VRPATGRLGPQIDLSRPPLANLPDTTARVLLLWEAEGGHARMGAAARCCCTRAQAEPVRGRRRSGARRPTCRGGAAWSWLRR